MRVGRTSVIVVAGALTLAGCGSTGGGGSGGTDGAAEDTPSFDAQELTLDVEEGSLDGRTICFSFQALETEFWAAGVVAISEGLRTAGAEVIEYNSNEDANRQLEQIQDCITQDVDGIIFIPQDGESAVTIIGAANDADVPIAAFNRPPADDSRPAIVAVADNREISRQTNEYLAEQARALGRKVQPLIMVGDLGDENAVARRDGFFDVVNANPDLFETPIEVETKWDATTAQQNLQSALQANPDIDLLFTSSDFMYPQIQSLLEQQGRWAPVGEEGHVILGGLDGDNRACNLMRDGYVDATGVQDLFRESEDAISALTEAIANGETQPAERLVDPGFALTQDNLGEREQDMWGCVVEPPQ
jgi:inositol transport system substrate-binding protein